MYQWKKFSLTYLLLHFLCVHQNMKIKNILGKMYIQRTDKENPNNIQNQIGMISSNN